jgi:osmotically-inducible protein OsmY
MKHNESLQKEVQEAIKWEPLLHAAEIGVTAKDGIITLTGVVDSYSKKFEAETAAQKVKGVKIVVEKIEVVMGNSVTTTDEEIASEILVAFKKNYEIPSSDVKVRVEKGWVTLEGEVKWYYQKEASKKVIVKLLGVRGVTNDITIKSEITSLIEKEAIERAIHRNWAIKADDIKVTVDGTKVILTGNVESWYEREEAEKIAWSAPGVWNVLNELVVEYDCVLMY